TISKCHQTKKLLHISESSFIRLQCETLCVCLCVCVSVGGVVYCLLRLRRITHSSVCVWGGGGVVYCFLRLRGTAVCVCVCVWAYIVISRKRCGGGERV